MRIVVTFVSAEGEEPRVETVEPNTRDYIALERKFKTSLTTSTPSVEQLVFLAFNGLRRSGALDEHYGFEKFIDLVADIDSEDDEDDDDEEGGADPLV